jgi:hypothetical protein
VVDRVRADHESDRQRLAELRAREVNRPQVGGRHEVDSRLAATPQHQPAHSDVDPAAFAVDGEIGRRRDVRRAVEPMLQMHRQRGEIGILLHHFLARRVRHLDDLGLRLQAGKHLLQQPLRRGAERVREARAAAGDVAGERSALRAGPAEPHGLRVAFEHAGHIRQRHRSFDFLQLLGAERVEEAAQAETLEIHVSGARWS